MRHLKELLPVEREYYRSFLYEENFWQADTINQKGAFELLRTLGFINVTKDL